MDSSIVIYECPNGHQTVTRLVDRGETPIMIECWERRCGACAVKLDPQPVDAATRKPTREWYKPDRLRTKRLGRDDLLWVQSGGLLLRNLTPNREAV